MSLPDDLVVELCLEHSMNNKFSAIHRCNNMILFFTRSTFSIFEHLYKIKCLWSNNQYRWNIQKRIKRNNLFVGIKYDVNTSCK